MEIVAQHLSVAPHDALRHCAADIRVDFMPVQAEQLQAAAVQEEAVQFEAGIAKSDADPVVVHGFDVDRRVAMRS